MTVQQTTSAPSQGTPRPAVQWLDLLGVLLLIASAIFLWLALVPDSWDSAVGSCQPWPDGAEYAAVGASLARGDGATIRIAEHRMPSRYPPLFPLLVSLPIRLGWSPPEAVHLVNRLAAVAAWVGVAAFFCLRRRWFEAGLAACLLITVPAFVVFARSPMSELTSTLWIGLGTFLMWSGDGRKVGPVRCLGAAILGAAIGFRLSNVFFLGLLPAAVWVHRDLRVRERIRQLGVLGAGSLAGAAPLLTFNQLNFGHPLSTGYDFWVPYWNTSRAFAFQHILPNVRNLLRDVTQHELGFTTANHYGNGSYLHPGLIVVLAVGVFVSRNRSMWLLACSLLAPMALLLSYYIIDVRLLVPSLLLAVPPVADSLGRWARRATNRWKVGGLLVFVALAVAGSAGPGTRSDSMQMLAHEMRPDPLSALTAQLQRARRGSDALVLTDVPPPLLASLLGEQDIVVPLTDEHLYRFNPQRFRFGHRERTLGTQRALEDGLQVWALTRDEDIRAIAEHAAAPLGHTWEIVSQSGRAGLARLVPEAAPSRSVATTPEAPERSP